MTPEQLDELEQRAKRVQDAIAMNRPLRCVFDEYVDAASPGVTLALIARIRDLQRENGLLTAMKEALDRAAEENQEDPTVFAQGTQRGSPGLMSAPYRAWHRFIRGPEGGPERLGPPDEICEVCQCDPRNDVHHRPGCSTPLRGLKCMECYA